jgi:hypothetical protein
MCLLAKSAVNRPGTGLSHTAAAHFSPSYACTVGRVRTNTLTLSAFGIVDAEFSKHARKTSSACLYTIKCCGGVMHSLP